MKSHRFLLLFSPSGQHNGTFVALKSHAVSVNRALISSWFALSLLVALCLLSFNDHTLFVSHASCAFHFVSIIIRVINTSSYLLHANMISDRLAIAIECDNNRELSESCSYARSVFRLPHVSQWFVIELRGEKEMRLLGAHYVLWRLIYAPFVRSVGDGKRKSVSNSRENVLQCCNDLSMCWHATIFHFDYTRIK